MRTEYLEEFFVFSRYMNVTHAARELNLSQPVLSSHLAAIEKELGFKLIDHTRAAHLTPEGELFLEGAEAIIDHYHQLISLCKAARKTEKSLLVLEKPVVSISIERVINKLLADFKSAHSNISTKVTVSQTKDLFALLDDNDVDLGVLYGERDWDDDPQVMRGYRFVPVPIKRRSTQYVWLSTNDPLATRDSVSLADLDGRSVRLPIGVHYKVFHDSIEKAFRGLNRQGTHISIKHSAGNLNESAARTRGDEIGILDEQDINEGRYTSVPNRVFVPLIDSFRLPVGRPYFACRIDNGNEALRQFIEHVDNLNARGETID